MKSYKNDKLLIEVKIDRELNNLFMSDIDCITHEPIVETEGIVTELNTELASDVSKHFSINLGDYNVSIVEENVDFMDK